MDEDFTVQLHTARVEHGFRTRMFRIITLVSVTKIDATILKIIICMYLVFFLTL